MLGAMCICIYILIPIYGYTYMSVYIHMYVCTQLWWRFFPTSNQLPSLQVFLGCPVLQLLPKGHTFQFHITKINSFQ